MNPCSMNNDYLCNICNKKVLGHAFYLHCTACYKKVHKQCISCISELDYIKLHEDKDWICIVCLENALPFCNIIDDDEYSECFDLGN